MRFTIAQRMISMISVHWALALLALGKYGEATERLREGLVVARETQDRWLVGTALGHLGMVMLAQGDPPGPGRLCWKLWRWLRRREAAGTGRGGR